MSTGVYLRASISCVVMGICGYRYLTEEKPSKWLLVAFLIFFAHWSFVSVAFASGSES